MARQKRKPAFVTLAVPFEELKPGDMVQCAGGFDELRRVEFIDNNYVIVHFRRQPMAQLRRSNWMGKGIDIREEGHDVKHVEDGRQFRCVTFYDNGQRSDQWLPEGYYFPEGICNLDGKPAMKLARCNNGREHYFVSEAAYHEIKNMVARRGNISAKNA